MIYDSKKIGERIRQERKKAGINQSKFAEMLGLNTNSRQTVMKWEKGVTIPDIKKLFNMCEIFNCELGYLLCEYDCKNKIAADVQTVTGLSEKAVMILHDMKTSDIRGVISVLNGLIEHPDFSKLLCAIYTHTENFNKKTFKVDDEYRLAIANSMYCSPNEAERYMETASKNLIESMFSQIILDLGNDCKEKGSSTKKSKLFNSLTRTD